MTPRTDGPGRSSLTSYAAFHNIGYVDDQVDCPAWDDIFDAVWEPPRVAVRLEACDTIAAALYEDVEWE